MSIFKRFGKIPGKDERKRIILSPHYNGGKFQNSIPTATASEPFKIMKAYAKSDSKARKPQVQIPVNKLKKSDFGEIPSKNLRLIWLGHVSLMIEMENKRLLVDPVLSAKASPFSFAGPQRFHEPPLTREDMPHIDLILLSHNHYDHLDYKLIRQFKNTTTRFITALGMETTLSYWGIENHRIHTLDWNESVKIDELDIIATPTRHFSGRTPFDRDKTFWCSFVLKGSEQSIFYEADSGYFEGFRETGDKFGPFDLSLMGIGAYNKFWADIHTFPEEAIRAHLDLNADIMLPIHWCTFNLAIHPWIEPIERTIEDAKKNKVKLIIPQPGEWVDITKEYRQKTWWGNQN